MLSFSLKLIAVFFMFSLVVPPVAYACNPKAECRRCVAKQPRVCVFGKCSGGNCIQHYNDPGCEVKKAECQACILSLTRLGVDPITAMKQC